MEALEPGTCSTSSVEGVDERIDGRWAVLAADRRVVPGVHGQDVGVGCVLRARIDPAEAWVDLLEVDDVDGPWRSHGGVGVGFEGALSSWMDRDADGGGAVLASGWSAGFGGELDGWLVTVGGVLVEPASWLRFGGSEIQLPDPVPSRFFAICTTAPELDEDQVIAGEADGGWTFEVRVTPW